MRAGKVTALAVVVLTLATAPAFARPAVDAGAMRAEVTAPGWSFALTDARGDPILTEHPSHDVGGAGALGFRTLGGWQHATRVLNANRSARAYVARLATTDSNREIEVRLAAEGRGVISLDAQVLGPSAGIVAVGVGFRANPTERYLGFGERSDETSRTSGTVENYVADGPYQSYEYPALEAITPGHGLREGRPDATYYPVPWLLSSEGYGVLVDNPQASLYRLRNPDAGAWSVEVSNAPENELGAETAPPVDRLALRFFAGPQPADALRRFSAATGRQPNPAAPWLFGPWYQASGSEAEGLAALRAADAPVSVLQTYLHYLPCGDQRGREVAQHERTAAAHAAGVAITTYFNPMICTSYTPAYSAAAAAGALTDDPLGNPYVYRYGADIDDIFFVSQFDFFTPAGRSAYAELLAEAQADGYDGWMEDFGEYTPLDSVSAGSIPGTEAHNRYPTEYHCAAYNAIRNAARPVIRFQRSGWTGATGCAQVVWGGDPTTGWGFDGLRSAVRQALSAGSSGIAYWGSDIGGFFALGPSELTPELLTRWVQLGAASPVMRTQANGVALPPRTRPQVTDPDQIDNWRRYAALHTQLYPYFAAASRVYRKTGMPIVRDLALAYPQAAGAAGLDDQYLLGRDLLVAPVLDPGATERSVYLPPGRWVELWRSATYREGPGTIALNRAKSHRGNRRVDVAAPLEELPLFVRAGAAIALLDHEVDTLARYGKARDIVSLRERDTLRLLVFPRGRSRSPFGKRGSVRATESRAGLALRIADKTSHRYRIEISLATLRRPFAPCAVRVDGEPLAPDRWDYDRAAKVLYARVAAREAALEISRACGSG